MQIFTPVLLGKVSIYWEFALCMFTVLLVACLAGDKQSSNHSLAAVLFSTGRCSSFVAMCTLCCLVSSFTKSLIDPTLLTIHNSLA